MAAGALLRQSKAPPAGRAPEVGLLLGARALRAFGDGLVSLLLPVHLTGLGYGPFEIGALATATLLGSAVLTLAAGLFAHRLPGSRSSLLAAALLMTLTGLAFPLADGFWPLLLIAFVGTINPSSGDVSIFLPLEQARLADVVPSRGRTAMFARYSLIGSLAGAIGALCAGVPELVAAATGIAVGRVIAGTFLLYALLGMVSALLYRRLPRAAGSAAGPAEPLRRSRRIVLRLAALFSLDAFAGGLAVQSLLALWLFDRFGVSLATAGGIFFWTGLLSAVSYLVAVKIADRIGLINTMVFTHLPANVCLVLVPFAADLTTAVVLLLVRSLLSQMDVPTRTSYVMAVVTPGERAAAASVTAVPRSLASALAPLLAGQLLALSGFGWPLVLGGGLKIAYDLMLLAMFRHIRPPEEGGPGSPMLGGVSDAAQASPTPRHPSQA